MSNAAIKTPDQIDRTNVGNHRRYQKSGKCSDCDGGGLRLVPDTHTWRHYVFVTCHRCGGDGAIAKTWD